jgi:hypothetical protein
MHTTPAHIMAAMYAYEMQHPIPDAIVYSPTKTTTFASATPRTVNINLSDKFMGMDHVDRCIYACSEEGCRVVDCAVRKMLSMWRLHSHTVTASTPPNLDTVARLIDLKHPKSTPHALAVIQTLTFEKLGLKHTCCAGLTNPKYRQSNEEAQDIRYVEIKDIERLESFMTDFEHSWSDHEGTFHEYVANVWGTRMEAEVESSSEEVSSEYIERIGKASVVLWEPFGPRRAMSGDAKETSRP